MIETHEVRCLNCALLIVVYDAPLERNNPDRNTIDACFIYYYNSFYLMQLV